MTFERIDWVGLLALIPLVLLGNSISTKAMKWYRQESRRMRIFTLPVYAYPLIWSFIYTCDVVAVVFVLQYTANWYFWSAAPIMAMFITSVLMGHLWMRVFFADRDPKTAASDPNTGATMKGIVICFLNFVAAALVTVFIGVSQENLTSLYYIPLIFSCFRPAFTLYALMINCEWYRMETGYKAVFGVFSWRFGSGRRNKQHAHEVRMEVDYDEEEQEGEGDVEMPRVNHNNKTYGHSHIYHHKDHTHGSHHPEHHHKKPGKLDHSKYLMGK